MDVLEKTVVAELQAMMDEYLAKDELEQQIIFKNGLNEKGEKIKAEITAYEMKIAEYA